MKCSTFQPDQNVFGSACHVQVFIENCFGFVNYYKLILYLIDRSFTTRTIIFT